MTKGQFDNYCRHAYKHSHIGVVDRAHGSIGISYETVGGVSWIRLTLTWEAGQPVCCKTSGLRSRPDRTQRGYPEAMEMFEAKSEVAVSEELGLEILHESEEGMPEKDPEHIVDISGMLPDE